MVYDIGAERRRTAKEYHGSGRYREAASEYVAAAYEFLGENGLEHSVSAARGLQSLAVAACCHRFLGDFQRCQNICWQGVYVSQLVAQQAEALPEESHPHDQSESGVWYEFEADFRAVGTLPDLSTALDHAETAYRDAGDPQSVSLEQFHGAAAQLTKMLVRGTDGDTDELETVLGPTSTLTDWIQFKRQTLPA